MGGDWVYWRGDRRAGLKLWPVCCGSAEIIAAGESDGAILMQRDGCAGARGVEV